jgi:putative intracellular protease/amidase
MHPRTFLTNPMKTATIVVFDQFTDVDVFLPWDLLNRAKRLVPDWQVKLVGTGTTHTSVTGIELAMHGTVEACNAADLVFFASGPGTRMWPFTPAAAKDAPCWHWPRTT